MNTTTKIVLLYRDKKDRFSELPDTSSFLSEKQLIPSVGDALTLCGNDYKLLGISSTDLENVTTITKRWFNYASYDVALICNYVRF
jgi:hypothetical protein